MTTKAANSTVVVLETHPVWRSSRRHSQELAAAMRRHPSSYRLETEGDDALDVDSPDLSQPGQRSNGRVVPVACARVVKLSSVRSTTARD